MDIRETNSDYEMEKKIICKYSRLKMLTIIIPSQRLKTNCLDVCYNSFTLLL